MPAGEWSNIGNLVAYGDGDGDAAQKFMVWDDSGTNSFWLGAVGDYIDASAGYELRADQLAGLWVQGDSTGGTEQTLWIQAYDGTDWSKWDSFKLTTKADQNSVTSGDDIITIDETGSKTIDGGAGTDILNINVTDITSIDSFSSIHRDTSTGYLLLTSKTGDVISIKNIEKLFINNIDYGDPSSNNPSGFSNVTGLFYVDSVRVDGSRVANFFSTDEVGGLNSQNLYYAQALWPNHTDVIFRGTDKAENLNLTFSHNHQDRSNISGIGQQNSKDFILDLKDGNDIVSGFQPINTDTINLGKGDDRLSLKISGDGTTDRPNYNTLNVSTLDGGEGSDWIIFTNDGNLNKDQTLSLNTGGATNFENLGGSSANEFLYGDNKDNIIGWWRNFGVISGSKPTAGGTDSVYGLVVMTLSTLTVSYMVARATILSMHLTLTIYWMAAMVLIKLPQEVAWTPSCFAKETVVVH